MVASVRHSLEDAFSAIVHQWFAALAECRDADAVSMIDEVNSYGIRWTPESIRTAIVEYGAKEVSPPDTVLGTPHSNLIEFDDGSGFAYDHDMPLDGAWSDLTAQFEFLRRDGGFAVVLQDLHVL